jgi:hypothetical protein
MSKDISELVRSLVNGLGEVEYLGRVRLPGGCGNRGWMAWPDEYATFGEPSYAANDEEQEKAFKSIVEIGEPAVPVLIEEYKTRRREKSPALREDKIRYDGIMEGILSCLSEIGSEDALCFLRTVAEDLDDRYNEFASRLLKKHEQAE